MKNCVQMHVGNDSILVVVSLEHVIMSICDRLWEKGAYGAENKNVVFNLF